MWKLYLARNSNQISAKRVLDITITITIVTRPVTMKTVHSTVISRIISIVLPGQTRKITLFVSICTEDSSQWYCKTDIEEIEHNSIQDITSSDRKKSPVIWFSLFQIHCINTVLPSVYISQAQARLPYILSSKKSIHRWKVHYDLISKDTAEISLTKIEGRRKRCTRFKAS